MESNWEASTFIMHQLVTIVDGSPYGNEIRRIATWKTPEIDYAYRDEQSGRNIALVFFANVFEIKALLDRLLKASCEFDCIIACFDASALSEANNLSEVIAEKRLTSLPIGIVVYDTKGNIVVLKKAKLTNTAALKRTENEDKSYWCFWRDGSHYEIATLLQLSYKYRMMPGDIYSEHVYPEFYSLMVDGKTRQWNGKPRKKAYSQASYKAEKQNYKIPMFHLGLWTEQEGRLTAKGIALLKVVQSHGVESRVFFDCLAKLILIDGRHLDLIKDLEAFQSQSKALLPATSAEFFQLFDLYLMNNGSIGTRKPSAVTTGAKNAYLRDEPKIWNKFGFIFTDGSRYYRPFEGIRINWDRISEVMHNTALSEAMKDEL